MNRKRIYGVLLVIVLLCVIGIAKYEGSVLGARRDPSENEQEVEAYYYTNRTGKSSKYITYKECEEVGVGTIIFEHGIDALIVRNSPSEVITYLNEIPDYSEYLAANEDIKWMTIYRSRGTYRVIGEIIEVEPVEETEAESDFEPSEDSEFESSEESDGFFVLGDEEVGAAPDERMMPEEGAEEPEEEIIEEEIVEEVVEEVIPTEYDTVADLVSSEVTSGMTVTTAGYYSAGDGGGATYDISESKGKVYEKLDSGLYANLQYDVSINIKQLGAVGDGSADDSSYLEKAFSLAKSDVVIPEGSFNLANKAITVPKGVSISGIDRDKSELLNLNLTAPNGINMSDITCIGGTQKKVLTPAERLSNSVMIDVSPKGTQKVSYTRCTFREAGIASFAFAKQEGKFASDEATECIFEKIDRVAVYHSVNSDYTYYYNNKFYNIGSERITYGPVSAIWIGDVTNNTYTKSKDITILGNEFKTLKTADDFVSVHALNANFICIRGDTALVEDNEIEDLLGYGHDRESIYTKVSNLTVNHNTIKNGGCGEGYICNKGTEGDLYAVVTNNTLIGEFGCGIRQYGPATINDNIIEIDYCTSAITTTSRGDQVADATMMICGNKIHSGIDGDYYLNGKEVTDYSATNLIKVISPLGNINISGNEIYPGTAYSASIAVGNAKGDIIIENNTVDSIGKKGNSISVYNNAKGKVNPEQSIKFINNKLSVESGQKGISITLTQQSTVRSFEMIDNVFTFSKPTSWNYPLSMSTTGTNNDSLEVSGNTANSAKKKTAVAYSANTFINNDADFATYTKR